MIALDCSWVGLLLYLHSNSKVKDLLLMAFANEAGLEKGREGRKERPRPYASQHLGVHWGQKDPTPLGQPLVQGEGLIPCVQVLQDVGHLEKCFCCGFLSPSFVFVEGRISRNEM